MRVLLVDDSPTIRLLTRMFLSQSQVECVEAAGGPQGLLLARRGTFDAVIVDYNMPGMDGLTFIRALRSDPSPAIGRTKVLLLSANLDPGLEGQALSAGADAFCRKPITREGLLSALGGLTARCA